MSRVPAGLPSSVERTNLLNLRMVPLAAWVQYDPLSVGWGITVGVSDRIVCSSVRDISRPEHASVFEWGFVCSLLFWLLWDVLYSILPSVLVEEA